MRIFRDPEAAKAAITELLGETLLAWGDATPVRFSQRDDAWDFEIAVRKRDRCDVNGCVLASAFFPDAGQHELRIYPQMFAQSRKEKVDTLAHEVGHVFDTFSLTLARPRGRARCSGRTIRFPS